MTSNLKRDIAGAVKDGKNLKPRAAPGRLNSAAREIRDWRHSGATLACEIA